MCQHIITYTPAMALFTQEGIMAQNENKQTSKIPTKMISGINEVSSEDLHTHLPLVQIIDVRGADEFNDEFGHIQGAKLVTLGPNLTQFLQKGDRNQELVFVCRSGGRSQRATAESIQLGYKATYNLTGGMMRWNALKLPVKHID
jgi:rhodanese-related sulfurtransferase